MSKAIFTKQDVLHARPAAVFSSPKTVLSQTFMRQRKIDQEKEMAHCQLVVQGKQLVLKEQSDRYMVFITPGIELIIEIHHEFISYIWILSFQATEQNINNFITTIPDNWLHEFPGKLLNKTCISFENKHQDDAPVKQLKRIFGDHQLIGNLVENDSACVWTSFYRDKNTDLLRFYVEDIALGPRRTGRLAQNLIDLENYRSMAAIAFPIAEEITFELEDKELSLAKIIKQIANASNTLAEKELLRQLLNLSVISEEWRSKSAHRFSATDAYRKIIEDRLIELDEKKVLGYQPISKFLIRATMPTFRTCDAANERLNLFILRIDRAIALLSTRIRVTVEEQNQALLHSANTQSKQQMILQETIEAFSIVAISYYAGSLIKYLLEALKHSGVAIDPYRWTGILLPVIFISTLFSMRFLRKRISKKLSQLNLSAAKSKR